MTSQREYYVHLEQAMLSQAKAAGILTAPLSKGRAREELIKEFLQKHVPQRLGVEQGEVVDSRGASSDEADIVLVDNQIGRLQVGGESVVPVEAASLIESKSILSLGPDGGLALALAKVARTKDLQKTPHHGFYRAGHGDERVPIPPTRANCYVIAFDAPSWESIIEFIGRSASLYNNDYYTYGPELICVLARGFLFKNDNHVSTVQPGTETWERVVKPDMPGLEHLIGQIQENLSRYGSLTYEMTQYS